MQKRRRELLYSLTGLLGGALVKLVLDNQADRGQVTLIQTVGTDNPGAQSTLEIDEGDFVVWELGFDDPMEFGYSIEVIEGPPIDVILSDADEHPLPEGKSEWTYYPEASSLNVEQATKSTALPPANNYLIIFDNSNRLEAKPPTNGINDAVIVNFEFSLTPVAVGTDNGTESATPAGTPTPAEEGAETETPEGSSGSA